MSAATRSSTLLGAIAFALFGCDPAGTSLEAEHDKQARIAILGTWYGTGSNADDGSTYHYVMTLHPDGSETIRSKIWHSDGTISTKHESGKWYVTDGIFKLKRQVIEGDRLRENEGFSPYRIVAIEKDRITYRDELQFQPIEYTVQRVNESFDLDQVKAPPPK